MNWSLVLTGLKGAGAAVFTAALASIGTNGIPTTKQGWLALASAGAAGLALYLKQSPVAASK